MTVSPVPPLPAADLADQPTRERPAVPALGPRIRREGPDLAGLAPGAYLRVELGDDARMVPLRRGVLALGRGFAADVRLDDHTVSRRHALIAVDARGARILDDRSANGTYVNGRRVTAARLTDGDVVVLGQAVLTYVEVEGPRPPLPVA